MSWQVGLVCNAVISVTYFLIVLAIVVPLVKSHQLRSNPLGAATAAIFFTCAVHHGAHTLHMLMPYFGVDEVQGMAMREAWGWPLAIWDLVGAAVGVYYLTLRRNYSSLMQGAKLFEDLRQREQQALEINDNVLQGLVVAKMALDLDQPEKANDALSTAIESASKMITELLGNDHFSVELLRSAPALADGTLGKDSDPTAPAGHPE